jgi:DNA-binding response OmpR family regulator
VTSTNTLRHAMVLAEHDGLSAAILDNGLLDGDSSNLCHRLNERGIPFVIYSGFRRDDVLCEDVPYFTKPEHPDVLVAEIVRLVTASRCQRGR